MEENHQEEYPQFRVKCERCGGYMVYSLATQRLKCRFCGFERELTAEDIPIEKYDYVTWQQEDEKCTLDHLAALEPQEVRCPHCGGSVPFGTGIYAKNCDFCGSPLQLSEDQTQRYWKVGGLLPFRLDEAAASKAFRKWIRHSWLAPERLRRMGTDFSRFKGYYLPFWLYDVDTETDYDVNYNDTRFFKKKGKFKVLNFDTEMHRSGTWEERLENVVTPANRHFEREVILKDLNHWDFEKLVPFNPDYLRGYVAELYTSTFLDSRQQANVKIREIIEKHIAGEGASSIKYTRFSMRQKNATFRLVLLPLWISSFRYGKDVCPFVINARNGEVSGIAPVSKWKLFFLFLGIAILGIVSIFSEQIWNYCFG